MALHRKECEDEVLSKIMEGFLPLHPLGWGEASLEGTVFTGWNNEIRDNGKGDLCPPDYSWRDLGSNTKVTRDHANRLIERSLRCHLQGRPRLTQTLL